MRTPSHSQSHKRAVRLHAPVLLLIVALGVLFNPARAECALGVLLPAERDEEAWHLIDRKHFNSLVSSSADTAMKAEALFWEYADISRELLREIRQGATTDGEIGFRVYGKDSTRRIHVLSLAKRAREDALEEYVATGRIPATVSYSGILDVGDEDGTWLDRSGLKAVQGAVVAKVEDCVAALKSVKGLPKGTLQGFAYYLSPWVFSSDAGHAFTSSQPGPEEWAAVSALAPGFDPDGFPRDTVIHETGHLVHFEYLGPLSPQNELWNEYVKLRGKPITDTGAWEGLTAENFAEDFRVVFSSSTQPHRGSYGQPNEAVRKAFTELVLRAVSKGPVGSCSITGMGLAAGQDEWAWANAPAAMGTYVTRNARVVVSGRAQPLESVMRPALGLYHNGAVQDHVYLPSGEFNVTVPLASKGVYVIRKAYLNPRTNVIWEMEPGLKIIRLGGDSVLADAAAHWARRDLAVLRALGVLSGYPDGKLRADVSVSRAEFIKMLCVLMGKAPSIRKPPFEDAAAHWSWPYVSAAWEAGWLRDYHDSFAPDAAMTRLEMASILSYGTGLRTQAPCPFPDVPAEYRTAVARLASDGITRGFPSGLFEPYRQTTRAEAATILVRLRKALLAR